MSEPMSHLPLGRSCHPQVDTSSAATRMLGQEERGRGTSLDRHGRLRRMRQFPCPAAAAAMTPSGGFSRLLDELVRRERRRGPAPPGSLLTARFSGPTLLVPASRGVRARSIDVHRTFVGLRLSSKEVFDLDPTWDDLKQCLASYTLAQILDLAGRVSAVLATGPAGDPEIQRDLVFAIFGSEAARVWTGVETSRAQWAREGELRPTVAIFDELQLVNLVKIAFLLLPLTSDLGTKSSPEGFGRGLLMLNALIEKDPSSLSLPDLSTDAGWRQGLYHLFVNGIFHHGELDLHVLARCYDLYLSDKPHLAECGAYVDLPALVRSTTGLEPDGFWAVLFALVGHTITLARTPATGGPIHRRTYFTRNFRFTTEESERFFAFAAADARTIRDEITNLYALSSIRPFHILPLAQHPLVSLGDYVFCPSAAQRPVGRGRPLTLPNLHGVRLRGLRGSSATSHLRGCSLDPRPALFGRSGTSTCRAERQALRRFGALRGCRRSRGEQGEAP